MIVCIVGNITSVNTSAAIRIAALAQQRGAVRNITFESFQLVGVRGNAIDIDAYGQGIDDSELNTTSLLVPDEPEPPVHVNVPCASSPLAPLPNSCMLIDRMLIRNVWGNADKAGQILCGKQCAKLRME